MEYNIYCDESCHLLNDGVDVMVLGALLCPKNERLEISRRIREIKTDHGLSSSLELKMNKISFSKYHFYRDVLDYFFDNDSLQFRGVIIPNKDILRHEDFCQSHDGFYYKMLFTLLKVLFAPRSRYYIYIDRKDTRSAEKARELHNVLCNNQYDFQRNIICNVQPVHSHESELLQLVDFLTGLIAYANRGLSGNKAKTMLVERMKRRSCYSLTKTTLYREEKINLLAWHPRKEAE